jgi:hypothetical protein
MTAQLGNHSQINKSALLDDILSELSRNIGTVAKGKLRARSVLYSASMTNSSDLVNELLLC